LRHRFWLHRYISSDEFLIILSLWDFREELLKLLHGIFGIHLEIEVIILDFGLLSLLRMYFLEDFKFLRLIIFGVQIYQVEAALN